MTGQTIYVSADAGENGDGSQDAPYCSIQAAIDAMAPGDTISVGAGVYEENVKIKDGGTADAPVRIVSADGPGAAVIRPADPAKDTINIGGADYVEISGFELFGSSDDSRQVIQVHANDHYTNPATHITITDNIIHRGAGDGIKLSKSNDITIEGNTIEGGGTQEAAIDMVGCNDIRIIGNTITDIDSIGIMIKGGSQRIDVLNNILDTIGRNAIEVGGYTPTRFYPLGFLEDGNTSEASDVHLSGNEISNVVNTAIRIIGAIRVTIENTTVTDAGTIIKVDDSSKFHEIWFADALTFVDNVFDDPDWLLDRSDRAYIREGAAPEYATENSADSVQADDGPVRDAVVTPDPDEIPIPAVPDGDALMGGSGNDKLRGDAGDNLLVGGGGNDKLIGGAGNDILVGGDGKDKLNGGGGDDWLVGGSGKDKLDGKDGNDILQAGDGNDLLRGGNGDDILVGGLGNDTLAGGKDADIFVFRDDHLVGNDKITDFDPDEDLIDLSSLVDAGYTLDFAQTGQDLVVSATAADWSLLVKDYVYDADDFIF